MSTEQLPSYVAASVVAVGHKAPPRQTRMMAPSQADVASQSRPPTGRGLAEVVCGNPRPESGPGVGEKKV